MSDRLTDLEDRVTQVEVRLTAIEKSRPRTAPASAPLPQEAVVPTEESEDDGAGVIALAGRSVLILGGATILRALTESAVLPQLGGVAAGLLYAAFWIWHGGRAAAGDRRFVGAFDCATAAVIAYPLIWETTTRFHLIDATTAGALILILSLALLWTAARTSVPQIAWIASSAGAVAFGAVAVGAHSTLPLLVCATLFAVVTWQVAAVRAWPHVAWPAIAASDLLALALIGAALIGRSPHDARNILIGSMIFAAIWIAALTGRSVLRHHEWNLVEVAQLIESTLIGTVGAAIAARITGASIAPVAWFALAVAVGMGAATWTAAKRGLREVPVSTSFAATIAALLALPLLFGASVTAIVCALIAVAAAEGARHVRPLVLALHSVIWTSAAAIAGGTIIAAVTALIDRAPAAIRITAPALVVAVLALVAFVRIDAISGARAAAVVLLSIGAGGLFAGAMRVVVGVVDVMQPAQVALARTILLALAASLLGISGRLLHSRSARIVARGVLALGALKLVFEDLRVSSAAILVVAFTAYGLGMLVVARSPRRSHHPAPAH